jgi:uncharacterized coiled-coil protein SlyX
VSYFEFTQSDIDRATANLESRLSEESAEIRRLHGVIADQNETMAGLRRTIQTLTENQTVVISSAWEAERTLRQKLETVLMIYLERADR